MATLRNVKSSTLQRMGYDRHAGLMIVQFRKGKGNAIDRTYYYQIGVETFRDIRDAPSPGSMIWTLRRAGPLFCKASDYPNLSREQ